MHDKQLELLIMQAITGRERLERACRTGLEPYLHQAGNGHGEE